MQRGRIYSTEKIMVNASIAFFLRRSIMEVGSNS